MHLAQNSSSARKPNRTDSQKIYRTLHVDGTMKTMQTGNLVRPKAELAENSLVAGKTVH